MYIELFQVASFLVFLQPYVSYIFYCFAGVLGLIAHYILPQLRKALPWLCCAHPVLKSREYHLYEVKGTFGLSIFCSKSANITIDSLVYTDLMQLDEAYRLDETGILDAA